MIDRITIQGFRSIRNVERLKLGRINALVGANGSGKSNLFGALELLRAVCQENLQNYVLQSGGAESILHFGAKKTESIAIEVSFTQPALRYRIELAPGDDDALHIRSEQVLAAVPEDSAGSRDTLIWSAGREARESELFALPAGERPAGADRLLEYLKGWRIYHFCDAGRLSPFRRTNQLHDNHELHPDGSNLAAFLYLLRAKYASSHRLILHAVQIVAPFFKDFALKPEELNEETLRFAWNAVGSDADFATSALSDASVRFIALATLLLQPAKFRPPVILLDEPELGLHPVAIKVLAALIQQASVKTQIIFATQSPQLLDQFEPKHVLVADRVDRSTRFTRCADDEERLLEWLEDYSLGELWLKNEIGGRPVPEAMPGGFQR